MRPRLLVLLMYGAVAATLLAAMGIADAATGGQSHRAPVRRSLPKISGGTAVGDGLRASVGRWSGAHAISLYWDRCNARGKSCKEIKGSKHHPYSGRKYKLTRTDLGHRIRISVEARNAWGHKWANSAPTAVIRKAGSPATTSPPGTSTGPTTTTPTTGTPTITTPTPPTTTPGSPTYFSTVPSSQNNGTPPAGIPRSDATCAAEVTPAAENRSQNTTANNTVPSNPSSITWNSALETDWPAYGADVKHVTGDFKGTTDEILQWTACKWGIDENIVRADAVLESDWIQSTVGDNCGVAGEASYGILQAKNKDCSGDYVNGGWPYTQDDTALDADYWGARLRACYDGAFYEAGSSWLYGGQTIKQVIAANGDSYALWGCIGAWYSGNWYDSGAQQYITKVQGYYSSKPWLKPGF